MKNNQIIKNVLGGLVVGTSTLIPGLSGGTIAIIIGIYDKLIHAISSITKLQEVKKNLWFLLQFGVGAALGIVAFSRLIELLLSLIYLPMMFLFIGIILGSLPTLFKKANSGGGKPRIVDFVYIAVGLGACVLTTLIPEKLISFDNGFSLQSILIICVSGIVIAVALVLPGISASHMLLILGLYEATLKAVEEMNLAFLIPLILSVGAGILVTTRSLERAMSKHAKATYLMIIGFVIASVVDIIPEELPKGIDIPICIATFIAGAISIILISRNVKETD